MVRRTRAHVSRERRRRRRASADGEENDDRLECRLDDLCFLCLALAITATATRRRVHVLFGVLVFVSLFFFVSTPGGRLHRLLLDQPVPQDSESDNASSVCSPTLFTDRRACWLLLARAYEATTRTLPSNHSAAAAFASGKVPSAFNYVLKWLNRSGIALSGAARRPPDAHNDDRSQNVPISTRPSEFASREPPLPPPPLRPLSVRPTYNGSLSQRQRAQYRIPPVIHQQLLAENTRVPGQYRETMRSAVEKHRHLDYWLWLADQLLVLVMERRPEMAALLSRAPRRVHRSDILRYLMVYEVGGFYMDLDMRAHRAIDPLLKRYDCVVSREPDPMSIYIWGQSIMLTNAAFGARAHHPFIGYLLERLRDRDVSGHVVGATGPLFMTQTFLEWARINHCPLPAYETLHKSSDPILVCGCAMLPWYGTRARRPTTCFCYSLISTLSITSSFQNHMYF